MSPAHHGQDSSKTVIKILIATVSFIALGIFAFGVPGAEEGGCGGGYYDENSGQMVGDSAFQSEDALSGGIKTPEKQSAGCEIEAFSVTGQPWRTPNWCNFK